MSEDNKQRGKVETWSPKLTTDGVNNQFVVMVEDSFGKWIANEDYQELEAQLQDAIELLISLMDGDDRHARRKARKFLEG